MPAINVNADINKPPVRKFDIPNPYWLRAKFFFSSEKLSKFFAKYE